MRKRLAAPIVFTIAAGAGCSSNPPETLHVNPPPPPEVIHTNPPPPPPPEVIHTNPPPPVVLQVPTSTPTAQVASDLPDPSGKGHVEVKADGTCVQYADLHCPPQIRCNPPPPHPVRCPGK